MAFIAKRRASYGSLPWGIFDTTCDRFIEVQRIASDGSFRGYVANFARKRDAQRAIDSLITVDNHASST